MRSEKMMHMYILGRSLVWLQRWRNSLGFGVQSPWAYQFNRNVVNEHYPYYAYDRLQEQISGLDKRTRKLCRLYFRIANWKQAGTIIEYSPTTDAYAKYMAAGCYSSNIMKIESGQKEDVYREALREVGRIDILCIEPTDDYQRFFGVAKEYVDDNSMFIIHHIKKNRETKAFWTQIVEDPDCVTTFDLYYCGIIFFNKKRYKENYIVNF